MKRWSIRIAAGLLAFGLSVAGSAAQDNFRQTDFGFCFTQSDTLATHASALADDTDAFAPELRAGRDTVYIRDTVFVFIRPGINAKIDSAYMAMGPNRRNDRVQRKRTIMWNKILPDYSKIQYAGGMGMFSFGTGWAYGRKNQWETDFFIGFVPHFYENRATMTLTLKQNYIPWSIRISKRFSFEPLESGLYFTYLASKKFWGKEPKKYGGPYYRYMQDLRANIFLGQRLKWDFEGYRLPACKAITLYYEVSTNDLYLLSYIPNASSLDLWDILVFSAGIKLHFM